MPITLRHLDAEESGAVQPEHVGPRLVGEDSICWQLERLRAIDIDTEEDFRFAELLMRYHKEMEAHGQG